MEQQKQEQKTIQVRISKDLAERASQKAKSLGVNLSQVVRIMLQEFLDNPQERLLFR